MRGIPICEPGGHGTFLPIFEWEDRLALDTRAVMYFVLASYCFLGIAIFADVFMVAIETITSQEVETEVRVSGRVRTVRSQLWNPTVANLTLMALGSSAPEILLACIELVSGNFYSGDLGSSTIVGSAAFNLLVISAVCIVAVPSPSQRKVSDVSVLSVTASFSVFAYLWMIFILMVNSPDVVEVWEGAVTLMLCPFLVVAAYATDVGALSRASRAVGRIIGVVDMETGMGVDRELLARTRADLVAQFGDVNEETVREVAIRAARHQTRRQSRAYYRLASTSAAYGRRPPRQAVGTHANRFSQTQLLQPLTKAGSIGVSFASPRCCVLENLGKVELRVILDYTAVHAAESTTVTVTYSTKDGTAHAGYDYIAATRSKLVFEPGETTKIIEVPIIDDDEVEEDEYFDVELLDAVASTPRAASAAGLGSPEPPTCTIGPFPANRVTIIDDDLPGVLAPARDHVRVKLGETVASVVLDRHSGAAGRVSCSYVCEDASARAGVDYEHREGTLVFESGMTTREVSVPLFLRRQEDDKAREEPRTFKVTFRDPTGGAVFEARDDPSAPAKKADKSGWLSGLAGAGGAADAPDSVTTLVTVDGDSLGRQARVSDLLMLSRGATLGWGSWGDQFRDAWAGPAASGGEGSGGDGTRDEERPGAVAWVLHVVALPWKLLAATVPPAPYWNGKVCFAVALLYIGVVTAIVGDLAALVGCALGMPELIVGITLVALGTSLPDTFASRRAAIDDPDADACIGNITGSNSVNVYLGLGLPWLGGALYWQSMGATPDWAERYPTMVLQHPYGAFVVPAGDLGFSVTVYVSIALCVFIVLGLRRQLYGAELGGPSFPARSSAMFLVILWFVFIYLVSEYSIPPRASAA